MPVSRVSPEHGEVVAAGPSMRYEDEVDDGKKIFSLAGLSQDQMEDTLEMSTRAPPRNAAVRLQAPPRRQLTTRIIKGASATAKNASKRVSCTANTTVGKLRERDTVQRAMEARHEELVGKLRIRAPSARGPGAGFDIVNKLKKTQSYVSSAASEDGSTTMSIVAPDTDRWRRARRNQLVGGPDDDVDHMPRAFGMTTPPSSVHLNDSMSGFSSRAESTDGSEDGNYSRSLVHRLRRVRRTLAGSYSLYGHLLGGDAPLRRIANGILAVTTLYFIVFTPFFLSFVHQSSTLNRTVDKVATAIFACDVLLGLTTSHGNDQAEVTRHYARHLKKYARGWMLVDLPAALPLDLISEAVNGRLGAEQALRLVHCVKVLKLPMLLRSMQGSLLWRISNEQRALFGIVRLLSTVLLAAHYGTCICERIASPARLIDPPIDPAAWHPQTPCSPCWDARPLAQGGTCSARSLALVPLRRSLRCH